MWNTQIPLPKCLKALIKYWVQISNGKKNPVVESVISNVAIGASDPMVVTEVLVVSWEGYRFLLLNLKKRWYLHRPYLDQIRQP